MSTETETAEEMARRHQEIVRGLRPCPAHAKPSTYLALVGTLELNATSTRLGPGAGGRFRQDYKKALEGFSVNHAAPSVPVEPASVWTTRGSKVEFLAGDYGQGSGYLDASCRSLLLPRQQGSIALSFLSRVEVASEESVKRIGGTFGWGAIGALALGPVGLLAGVVAGGKGTDVTFVASFSDGKRILGKTSSDAFRKIQAAAF